MPDPVECFQSLADHATMTGRKFEAGYAAAFESGSKRDKVDGWHDVLIFSHVQTWVQDSTSISNCWWYSADVCQCPWSSKTHFSVLYHQRGTNHIFFQGNFCRYPRGGSLVVVSGGWLDDARNPLRKFWVQGRMAWLAIGSQLQESPRFGVGRFGGPHGGSGSPLEKMVPQHILDVFKTFRKQWSLFILEGWRD